MRIFLIVIDSFGIGALPDAAEFGDGGSDTYGNIVFKTGLRLPEMARLGLNNIDGVAKVFPNGNSIQKEKTPQGVYARLKEKTYAKDTTAGHFEIAGLVLKRPYRIFKTFPPEIVSALEKEAGVQFIGNEIASGTEIIQRLGPLHLRTGKPIIYTSQDSVLQIAADTSVTPLERLYTICEAAREIMTGDWAVGRVIARPFIHEGGKFTRTEDRKDYALEPPGTTMLDELKRGGVPVVAIGKINDLFCGRGISKSIHTGNNTEGIQAIQECCETVESGLVFANLVDTDMLYGHRNDVQGYARALREIDTALLAFENALRGDDRMIITADHGCDPTTESTDHSREYVPLLLYGKGIRSQNLGTIEGFDCIADFILRAFQLKEKSLLWDAIEKEEDANGI